jgi:hypothetical protein
MVTYAPAPSEHRNEPALSRRDTGAADKTAEKS